MVLISHPLHYFLFVLVQWQLLVDIAMNVHKDFPVCLIKCIH